MSKKYIIFGATGSIGSSLAKQLVDNDQDVHLISRNQIELENLANQLNSTFTVADVMKEGFINNINSDINDVKGIAYCIGSIDLKPLRLVKEEDFNKCMRLNLYSAVEVIKNFQESLKKK